jgi:hypothetical protein
MIVRLILCDQQCNPFSIICDQHLGAEFPEPFIKDCSGQAVIVIHSHGIICSLCDEYKN